eukprot:8244761-Pyramimonas_sp.AAC.1
MRAVPKWEGGGTRALPLGPLVELPAGPSAGFPLSVICSMEGHEESLTVQDGHSLFFSLFAR